ncbi:MAG: type II toxin-antitoxin system VapC family toxin [Acidobacteria bacterium]|nr:type II toxin-antitoxin system VapC family toxin [Acidobacteriota bacterium]MBV9475866.1 type II toxin-antitoxin system VapC family toxin [Acidobacteriota bacterium]
MTRRVFVDTWFFAALLDARDSHHREARAIEKRYSAYHLLTHDAVLTELLSYFSEFGAQMRRAAVAIVRNAFTQMHVVHADEALFRRAVDLYEARPDKGYSLADCMSMLVMRDRGITHILTNDHHFRQEGFTVVSDAP